MTLDATRRRCLVVDDDPSIREVLRLNLEAEGMEVFVLENGELVETVTRHIAPDLIVLDVMMPGRDGYAVLAALKADEATSGVPVVLLTAKATDEEIWDGWQSGADYYITKPFNIDELLYFLNLVFEEEGEGNAAIT